ncbi:MAG: hypothetical protein WBM70_05690 [Sulfurovum sp.]|uniref:hypothetical protein n=1 Tax=Sulfurovum sp. TaxID=1969726 RepID=UPI003C7531A4
MGNTKDLLLAYPAMKQVTLSSSVNVMLPPQFYTVKKEALPLRYAYQAKKIAPSLFDGLLEEGKDYDYMVWKEEDHWVFLAYDLEMITVFLESKGFALENVDKIFFTQQAVEKFDKPLSLGANEALVSLDDMTVVVPKGALAEEIETALVFDNSFTPKKGVALHGAYGSILRKKEASILTAIFALFALMFFVEGTRYSDHSQAGASQMQELLEAYPSLQSKYTRDSIVSKYKTIDRAERKKREMIKTLSGMIFKGVTLTSLEMNEKMFKVQFSCEDAQVAKRVKALAQKNQLNILAVAGSNDVKIEGAL